MFRKINNMNSKSFLNVNDDEFHAGLIFSPFIYAGLIIPWECKCFGTDLWPVISMDTVYNYGVTYFLFSLMIGLLYLVISKKNKWFGDTHRESIITKCIFCIVFWPTLIVFKIFRILGWFLSNIGNIIGLPK